MRDYILVYINGKEHRVRGEDVFMPLSGFLRYSLGQTGTKVVCEEGDCGACTVLVGRPGDSGFDYQPVNACIQNVYQTDLKHVVTVEGLLPEGKLNAAQEAMVDNHGAQCGFCTPGIVVSLCAMFEEGKAKSACAVKDALTGNLCRCTGYEPIIKAALETDAAKMTSLAALYPAKPMLSLINAEKGKTVSIEANGKTFFAPAGLSEAIAYKSQNKGLTVIQGGTDVCVQMNKRGFDPAVVMSLAQVGGLDELKVENGVLHIGGKVTLSALERKVKDLLPELYQILWVFGSPQIKNAGTVAGNLVNASPIADTIPFMYVTDAELALAGANGVRKIKVGSFYKGYKKLDLADDELVAEICVPLPAKDETLKLYKVSKRKNLDISTFTAAFLFKRSQNKIEHIKIAYGGVAPTVLRLPKTEQFLQGKEFALETFMEAGSIAQGEIAPISDVRGDKEFRLTLAQTILQKLYYECMEEKEALCPQ